MAYSSGDCRFEAAPITSGQLEGFLLSLSTCMIPTIGERLPAVALKSSDYLLSNCQKWAGENHNGSSVNSLCGRMPCCPSPFDTNGFSTVIFGSWDRFPTRASFVANGPTPVLGSKAVFWFSVYAAQLVLDADLHLY